MVDKPSSVISAILLGTLSVLSFIVQPAEVQGLVSDMGMSDAAANGVIGLEMAGIALATILVALVGNRFNWRVLLAISLVLGVSGDLASAALARGPWLGAMRALSGLGHGGLISLSFTFIGLTRRVERNLALFLAVLLTYGALGILFMPQVLGAVHFEGLFLLFAAGTAIGFATIPFVPTSSTARQAPSSTAVQLSVPLLAMGLLAVLAYNIAMGSIWANLGLIGVHANLADAGVTKALAASQFVAIGGALAALMLERQLGRNRALGFGILAGAACIAALGGFRSLAVYSIAVCTLNFSWNFVQPFILAAVADFGINGRMMSFAVAVQMIGLSLGPILSSLFITSSDFGVIGYACSGLLVAAYALLLVPLVEYRRSVASV